VGTEEPGSGSLVREVWFGKSGSGTEIRGQGSRKLEFTEASTELGALPRISIVTPTPASGVGHRDPSCGRQRTGTKLQDQ
jgi:hypothetical protein